MIFLFNRYNWTKNRVFFFNILFLFTSKFEIKLQLNLTSFNVKNVKKSIFVNTSQVWGGSILVQIIESLKLASEALAKKWPSVFKIARRKETLLTLV